MTRPFAAALLALSLVGFATPAHADLTGFFGFSPTPDTHTAKGFAVGFGLVIVGFEFEYSSISEDEIELLPSLRVGSGNLLVQTPTPGIQLYGTIGGGVFRERLVERQETSFSTNFGGGAKIRLAGPLRARVDYRLFRLTGDPLHDVYHRFYVGANLAF